MTGPDENLTGAAGINLRNWLRAPFNRWAFHHVDAILPVAAIAPAPAGTSPLPDARRSLNGFSVPGRGEKRLTLEGFLEATFTDALVVLHRGQIVFEHYDGGTREDTPHIVMSATKALTGLLVAILEARGEIRVDARVCEYAPETIGTPFESVTLRQLGDMRAGVVLDDKQERLYGRASGWQPAPPDAPAFGMHDFFTQMRGPAPRADANFAYVSANTDLLGWAIERAAGESIAALISRHIWAPIGAERAAYITLDPKGAARCTGGLCATARDFARVGQAMLDARVGPDWLMDDLADAGSRDAWRKGEWGKAFARVSPNMSYRRGWYTIDDPPRTLFAMGVYGQNLFIDRTNQIVAAKLSSQTERFDFRAFVTTHRAFREIRRCVLASG